MEELNIAIEMLENKRNNLQLKIYDYFSYGKFPSDDEFVRLQEHVISIGKMEYALDELRELKSVIEFNEAD